jgi:hypothetical protein
VRDRAEFDLTAIRSFAPDDCPAMPILRQQLNHNAVPGKNPDKVFTHFARDVRQYLVPIVKFDPKHCIGQRLDDRALDLYRFFLCHILIWILLIRAGPLRFVEIRRK